MGFSLFDNASANEPIASDWSSEADGTIHEPEYRGSKSKNPPCFAEKVCCANQKPIGLFTTPRTKPGRSVTKIVALLLQRKQFRSGATSGRPAIAGTMILGCSNASQ